MKHMKKKQLQKILVPVLCAGLAMQPMAVPVLADSTTASEASASDTTTSSTYEEAKAAYDAAATAKADADTAVTNAQATVETAQTAYNEATNISSYTFFQWMGNSEIAEFLKTDQGAEYTHIGADGDATSIANLKKALAFLEQCNQLRESEGLSDLKVSTYAMEQAEGYANRSAVDMQHHGTFENLAWTDDPYALWYTKEKKNYESGSGETGHYLNLVNKEIGVTGYGFASTRSTSAQEFYYSADASYEYTVSEYEAKLDEYLASVDAAAAEKKTALTNAQTALADAQAKQTEAADKLAKAKAALDAASVTPTVTPTTAPTATPTEPTATPTTAPTDTPKPTETPKPTTTPTAEPTATPKPTATPTPELVRGTLHATDVDKFVNGSDLFLGGATIPNMKTVYFAVWSVNNGQDDLVWEKAEFEKDANGWYKDLELSDLTPKNGLYDGTYNVHCYAELEDGSMEFINSATFKVIGHDPAVSVDTETENQTYTATLSVGKEIIPNAKKIYFAVWSAVDGQDDMHWLSAADQSLEYDKVKTYTSDIKISDFNGSGDYNVHCYAQMADGSMKFLGSTTFTASGKEALDMYRMYNPNSGEHFYTSNQGERDHLVSVGWHYEGIGWDAPLSGKPIYRLYNKNSGDHHYTGSEKERDDLVKLGWAYEGVAWYTASSTGNPQYRLYNPNSTGAGGHFYTGSTKERDDLVKLGWNYEGIGWYGV